MVDVRDLKSLGFMLYGFESLRPHQLTWRQVMNKDFFTLVAFYDFLKGFGLGLVFGTGVILVVEGIRALTRR